jgi:hypothetical protein
MAVGKIPTAEYMWHLMAVDPDDAPSYTLESRQVVGWQPQLSPGLLTLDEYRKKKQPRA